MLPACAELGVGFVPFSPLGRAILTGAITGRDSLAAKGDFRAAMPRFQEDNLERNLALVERLHELASAKGCTRGQLALAWLLAQGGNIVPIPGTKRVSFLEENAAAADVELDAGELEQLDALFAQDNVAGERYVPAGMRSLDRD